jgi:hypothetical protein
MSRDTVRFSVESEDKLRKVTWTFWLCDRNLVVDSYIVEERPSRRHNFKITDCYARIKSSYEDGNLKEHEVPLTDEIRERAIREFTSSLRVIRWSEMER